MSNRDVTSELTRVCQYPRKRFRVCKSSGFGSLSDPVKLSSDQSMCLSYGHTTKCFNVCPNMAFAMFTVEVP